MRKKWDYFIKNVSNRQFLIGIVVFLVGQAITYYSLKFFIHSAYALESPVDNAIPFIPEMIFFYNLFYPLFSSFCIIYLFMIRKTIVKVLSSEQLVI